MPGLALLSLEERAALRSFPRFPGTDPASLAPEGRPLGKPLPTPGVGPARVSIRPRAHVALPGAGIRRVLWGCATTREATCPQETRARWILLARLSPSGRNAMENGEGGPAGRRLSPERLATGTPALWPPHSKAGLSARFLVSSLSWRERPFASPPRTGKASLLTRVVCSSQL